MGSLAVAAIPVLLLAQGVMGGIDTLLNHELVERLPRRTSAGRELGWHALRSSGQMDTQSSDTVPASALQLFGKGLFANAINPKVVMFFLAFLPQFVVADRGDAPWQIAQLGLIFTLQAALLFGLLGYFAGHVGRWVNRNAKAGLWLDRMAGTVFVGLGLKLIIGF